MYNENIPLRSLETNPVAALLLNIFLMFVFIIIWGLIKGAYSYALEYVHQNNDKVVDIIVRAGLIISSIVISILSFILRQKKRRAFGILEFTFGVIGCLEISNYLVATYNNVPATSSEHSGIYALLQIAAPTFVIGRALDNIVKSSVNPWPIFKEKLPS